MQMHLLFFDLLAMTNINEAFLVNAWKRSKYQLKGGDDITSQRTHFQIHKEKYQCDTLLKKDTLDGYHIDNSLCEM